ncbi:MAG: hypothetical protein ACYC46_15890 [Acidobacteriaceae bacterium]
MATLVATSTNAVYQVTGSQYAEAIADSLAVYAGYNNVLPGSITEVSGTTDAFTLTEATEVGSSLMAQDGTGFGGVYFSHRYERAIPQDHNSLGLFGLISDAAWSFDFNTIRNTALNDILDSIASDDVLAGAYTRVLADLVTATGSPASALSITINNALRLAGSTTTSLTASQVITATFALAGTLLLALPTGIAETMKVSAPLIESLLLRLTVLERARVAQILSLNYTAKPELKETIEFIASQLSGKGATITEVTTLAAIVGAMLEAQDVVSAIFTVSPSAAAQLRLVLVVGDSVKMIDPPTGQSFDPQQLLQALIQDQVSFGIGYIASNGIWTGWTLNATNQAVSNYAGWDFNSFTKFRGQYLGASNTQGIASLGGAQDGTAAITATLQSAVTDFGNSFLKRVKMAYIGMNANGTATFSTTTDDNVERVYQLVPDAPGLHTERVQLARGVMSRYWTFTLQAVGADFRVDEISLLPVTLERRI